MTSGLHHFDALAFVEDLPQKRLAETFPEARARLDALRLELPDGGEVFLYPFGAAVFHDVARPAQEGVLSRLRSSWPTLVTDVVREDFRVRETEGAAIAVADGELVVDRLSADRAAVVALTVAQSVGMETYEKLVDELFERTRILVADFERRGTMPLRTRGLHRFIAGALATRNEVLSVLHLLDKPEAVWRDPAMDRIYGDLRAEFDLADRYEALTIKLGGVQDTLELVLDVVRDRRGAILEAAIVALIVLEIVFAFLKIH